TFTTRLVPSTLTTSPFKTAGFLSAFFVLSLAYAVLTDAIKAKTATKANTDFISFSYRSRGNAQEVCSGYRGRLLIPFRIHPCNGCVEWACLTPFRAAPMFTNLACCPRIGCGRATARRRPYRGPPEPDNSNHNAKRSHIMAVLKVGINGFGRIGRLVFRAA